MEANNMFHNSKRDAFTQFYLSMEGRKILAYGELFLSQMREQIENDVITDFNRDYCFSTENYQFIFRFTKEKEGELVFLVYHLAKKHYLLYIRFYSFQNAFSRKHSFAYFLYKNDLLSFPVFDFPFFEEILHQFYLVTKARTKEIVIPFELIEQIERQKNLYPKESLEKIKEMLNDYRSLFSKHAFSTIAHAFKTVQETLPLLEKQDDSDYIKLVNTFTSAICDELPRVIKEYVLLSSLEREKQEEKLLENIHRFYLLALDIQEYKNSF